MKKALALILALLMCLALFACGSKEEPKKEETPKSETTPKEEAPATDDKKEPAADTPKEENPAEAVLAGYVDDDVDHYAREKYTICYAMPMETTMHDAYLAALEACQEKFNYELVFSNSNNDSEAYLQNLEIMAAKKIDGFLIDCPNAVKVRCAEIVEELGIPYISFVSTLLDEDGHQVCPGVIQNSYEGGAIELQWLADHYKEFWPDAKPEEIKLVSLTSSSYKDFRLRSDGAVDKFKELFPGNDIQEIDMTGKGVDAAGAYDMITPVITTQPDVKYWFVTCGTDNWGQGCTRAIEGANMQDICLVTDIGTAVPFAEWDAGYDGCWKAAVYFANIQLCAPAIAGVVALIDGRATKDTLWQELIVPGDEFGEDYGIFYVPQVAITRDNYKSFEADALKSILG